MNGKETRRFDWIWALTPVAILAYMMFVALQARGRTALPPERMSYFHLSISTLLLMGLIRVMRGGRLMQERATEDLSLLCRNGGRRAGEWRDYLKLTKPGLNGLVLLTTFVGFYLASNGPLKQWLCLRTLLGAGLAAAGASVLNQYLERKPDALMARTAARPLPQGRIAPPRAFALGVLLGLSGILTMTLTVHILAGLLTTFSLAVYLLLYTPLKRINSLSTLTGAISGALPPVIGWTASGRPVEPAALALFFILFLWQIPHFLAISWKYREQYTAAGFQMYCVLDPDGRRAGRQAIFYALILLPVSMMTSFHHLTGLYYLPAAFSLGLAYVMFSLCFAWRPTPGHTRALFLASIGYLPFLLSFMVWDKIG